MIEEHVPVHSEASWNAEHCLYAGWLGFRMTQRFPGAGSGDGARQREVGPGLARHLEQNGSVAGADFYTVDRFWGQRLWPKPLSSRGSPLLLAQ